MKKLFLFFGLLALVAMIACTPKGANAQERTVNITVPLGYTYYKYTGVAADTLKPTNQDTIDFVFAVQLHEYIEKVALKTRFDIIVGADTTVATTVAGKEFSDHTTYTDVIASTVSSAVTANNTVQVLVSDPYTVEAQYVTGRITGGDTVDVAHNHTPFDKSYRYYRVRYILQGNDAVGTGVKIDEIELKLYTD